MVAFPFVPFVPQADGLQGLDDFVRRLREKPMLEDMALGSA